CLRPAKSGPRRYTSAAPVRPATAPGHDPMPRRDVRHRPAAEGDMTAAEARAATGDTLSETLAGYRPATDTEAADLRRVHQLLADSPDPWPRDTPLHLTASAVIVHPPTRRVLLRWHARQQAWLQVGGHADPGEQDLLAIT